MNAYNTIVKNIVDKNRAAGRYTDSWNLTDENNQKVVEGIYYFELYIDGVLTQKHIYDAITEIESYVNEISFNEFQSNSMIQFASVKQLEIILSYFRHCLSGFILCSRSTYKNDKNYTMYGRINSSSLFQL
ncbi:MAG: hypothetical protein ACYCVH_12175 [Ignavibacteriaceae bacterium]